MADWHRKASSPSSSSEEDDVSDSMTLAERRDYILKKSATKNPIDPSADQEGEAENKSIQETEQKHEDDDLSDDMTLAEWLEDSIPNNSSTVNPILSDNNGDQEDEAEDKEAEQTSRKAEEKPEEDVDDNPFSFKKRKTIVELSRELHQENEQNDQVGGGPSGLINNGTSSSSVRLVGQAKHGNGDALVAAVSQRVLAGTVDGQGNANDNVGLANIHGDQVQGQVHGGSAGRGIVLLGQRIFAGTEVNHDRSDEGVLLFGQRLVPETVEHQAGPSNIESNVGSADHPGGAVQGHVLNQGVRAQTGELHGGAIDNVGSGGFLLFGQKVLPGQGSGSSDNVRSVQVQGSRSRVVEGQGSASPSDNAGSADPPGAVE